MISVAAVQKIDKTILQRAFLSDAVEGEDKGLVFDGEHIYQYVKRALYKTAERIEIKGYIVFFREFSQKDVADIIHDVGSYFSLKIEDPTKPMKRYSLREFATPTLKKMTQTETSIIAEFEYLLGDSERLPVNLIIENERELKSLMKTEILFLTQIFGLLLVACVMVFYLRKIVVKPIILMANHLKAQDFTDNQYRPLKLNNSSEIGFLANNIDQLFHRISEQYQFNQMLLDSNEDIILTVNSDFKITHANPSAQKWFGREGHILQGIDLNFALTSVGDKSHSLLFFVKKVLQNKEKLSEELLLRNNFQPDAAQHVELNFFNLEVENLQDSPNDQPTESQVLLIIRLKKF